MQIAKVGSAVSLQRIEQIARLMDAQFRIPGTTMRFGLDAIIGLIPGAGDLSTFAISGYLLYTMAMNGASGHVLTRMCLNVVIDTLIGSIPVIGDLFDFAFKANMRNLTLMKQYYVEGRHRGSAWKVLLPITIILIALFALVIYAIYSFAGYIFSLFGW